MGARRVAAIVAAVAMVGASAGAQEYLIRKPGEPLSTPTHLTRAVEGRVEVTNLPEVQEVRITGGTLEGPLDVRGEVGIRTTGPLAVEVLNPAPFPARLEVTGTVRVDDAEPLRVQVENLPRTPAPAPVATPVQKRFVAYAFRGEFTAKEARLRRTYRVPPGPTFQVTDLTLDARPDAVLKVRLTAPASAIGGTVVGPGEGELLPVAVFLSTQVTSVHLSTPVPLKEGFTLEVEALGPGEGAPFSVLASGYVEEAR